MLDAAEGVGVVARKGAWYSYGDTRLGQGREKTLGILEDDTGLAECAIHPMHGLHRAHHLHSVMGSLAHGGHLPASPANLSILRASPVPFGLRHFLFICQQRCMSGPQLNSTLKLTAYPLREPVRSHVI